MTTPFIEDEEEDELLLDDDLEITLEDIEEIEEEESI